MLRIGLTGGIGSGKTTVARIFEVLGIPVYYADDAAKRLMNTDEALKAAIVEAFGREAYTEGSLNRAFLASIVFNDPAKLALLNSLTHPATIQDANQWMERQHAPYTIKEAALIFESGSDEHLDFVIGVSAPEKLRIHRVMQRDGVTESGIRSRMARQMDEALKMEKCDFLVINDEHHPVIQQVLDLHHRFQASSI